MALAGFGTLDLSLASATFHLVLCEGDARNLLRKDYSKMTPTHKRLRDLRDRQSRERGRMAELSLLDELTDEQRSELDAIEKGTPDLERQTRAAVVALEDEEKEAETRAADNPDAERRERIELRAKAKLTNFLLNAARGRMVDGAEAELQSAAGVAGQGIPLELWDVPVERRDGEGERETRAITEAPGTVGVNLDPIRPAVFANSIAPRLGIEMPRVMSGIYASGTITTSQTASALDRSAAAVGTAGAITVQTATPKRISARLELTLEDIAAVGQDNFESILRENLALALSDQLDDQAINGNGTAPNLAGILQRLTDPTAAPTAVADFDAFVAAFAGGVDGLWANTVKEVAIVGGVETYRLSAATFRDPATGTAGGRGDKAFSDYGMEHYGGWWTNTRMPDPATFLTVSDVQPAILYRKGRSAMGASAGMRTAICPHWGEVSIDDIYSGSAQGERYFTMHVLLGDVILVQPNAYAQVAFQTA